MHEFFLWGTAGMGKAVASLVLAVSSSYVLTCVSKACNVVIFRSKTVVRHIHIKQLFLPVGIQPTRTTPSIHKSPLSNEFILACRTAGNPFCRDRLRHSTRVCM